MIHKNPPASQPPPPPLLLLLLLPPTQEGRHVNDVARITLAEAMGGGGGGERGCHQILR